MITTKKKHSISGKGISLHEDSILHRIIVKDAFIKDGKRNNEGISRIDSLRITISEVVKIGKAPELIKEVSDQINKMIIEKAMQSQYQHGTEHTLGMYTPIPDLIFDLDDIAIKDYSSGGFLYIAATYMNKKDDYVIELEYTSPVA